MAAIPYMPLYVADYLADAAHLSTVEHGAYLLLIMTYWQRGKALPNSNERLANVARMSNEEWMKVRDTLSDFFEDDGEKWVHERIERELAKFREKSDKARAAGQASAKRRSNKRSTDVQQTLNHTDTDTDTDTDKAKALREYFEIFYDTYPLKKSKAQAEKAFRKINPDELLMQKIMKALQAQAQEREIKKQAGEFVPELKHPATWLNAKAWEDEVDLSPRTGGTNGKTGKRSFESDSAALDEFEREAASEHWQDSGGKGLARDA